MIKIIFILINNKKTCFMQKKKKVFKISIIRLKIKTMSKKKKV